MSCSLTYLLTSISGDCSNTNSGGFTINITGTAPDYSIQWINPLLGTIPLGAGVTDYTIGSLSAGTYSFNILDSCTPTNNSLPININISSGTCISILNIENTTCGLDNGIITGETSNFYGVGQFSLYEMSEGFITSGESFTNNYTFNGLPSGIYYVIGNDGGGCTGQSETTIIKTSENIDWGFYVVNDSGCGDENTGKIFITGMTGTPPFTYLWSNGGTTDNITGLTEGTYTVTVSNELGCVRSKSVAVIGVPPIGVGTFTAVPPSCFSSDGSVTVIITGGTGPYYYSASTGEIRTTFSTSQTFTNLGSGIFSVEITDAALCKTVGTTNIVSPDGFYGVTVVTVNSNCGLNDGSMTITLLGGRRPFTFSLLKPNGQTVIQVNDFRISNFSNLTSGEYTISVSDGGECVYTDTYIIENSPIFNTTILTTGTTCNQSNGSVYVLVSGGTPPYTFNNGLESITTTLSGHTFNNIPSGVYSMSITESTPRIICNQVVSYVIEESEDVDFFMVGTDSINGTDGSIIAYVTNGEPPFILNWSDNVNGQTGYYIDNLSAGTYSLEVIDGDGCVKSRDITLKGVDFVSSYQSFNICDSIFENTGELIKRGPREMLIEGYYDLTSGFTNCVLNEAVFTLTVEISGITSSGELYVSTGLNDYPTDEEYINLLVSLIEGFDMVGEVIVNPIDNTIQIITKCDEEFLSPADVLVTLNILYNISCQYCGPIPSPTPTVTPTPTTTVTITPTQTITPTVTPTNTPTNTITPTVTPTNTQTPTTTPTDFNPTPTPTPTSSPVGGITLAQISNTFDNSNACVLPLTENIEINVALYGIINTFDTVYSPTFPTTFNGGNNNWHIILLDSPSITYDVQIDTMGEIVSVAVCP